MAINLFELALQITSKGFAEAKAALTSIDATGKKTAASTATLTEATKQQDLALRKLAEAGLRVSDVGRRMDLQFIKNNGGMARFLQIQKQLTEESRQADAVLAKLNTTTANTTGVANSAGMSVIRLRSGLTTLASQAIGTSSAVGQLASTAATLALGAGAGVAIIAGIAAIALAYNSITEGARAAKKEVDELQKSLSSQRKQAREESEAGREEQLKSALETEKAAQIAVDKLNVSGWARAGLHEKIEGRLAEATKNRIQAERNLEEARGEAIIARLDFAMRSLAMEQAFDADRKAELDRMTAAQKAAYAKREQQLKSHLAELNRIFAQDFGAGVAFAIDMKGGVGPVTPFDRMVEGMSETGVQRDAREQNQAREREKYDAAQQKPKRKIGDWPEPAEFDAMVEENFAAYRESIIQRMASMSVDVQQQIGQTLGDAIYNGFVAAFSGEGIGAAIAAFGKTILSGLGSIFTQMGQTYIEYGILMTGLGQFLWNPFTSGPAAIAIGAALVALGGILGGIAHKGGGVGRGTAGANFRDTGRGTEDIARYKFIDRNGNLAGNLQPRTPVNVTIIGPNDPSAQRAIVELIQKAERRAA